MKALKKWNENKKVESLWRKVELAKRQWVVRIVAILIETD